MNYPLLHLKARAECLRLLPEIDASFIGHMIGVLICIDNQGKEVVLKAFSGQVLKGYNLPNWVPPCFDEEQFQSIALHYDKLIKASEGLKQQQLSQEAQLKLFALYQFTDINKEIFTINEVFKDKLPPTGTGDCCEPKLLNYAFSHDLKPISMEEFYWEDKKAITFYPPCDAKCKPLLKHFFGLDIIYTDEHIIVINKPHGLLSVPGRTVKDSVVNRVKTLFPNCIDQPSVHRLDQDTSGLLLLAFDKLSHKKLSKQFEEKTINKEYIALVDGKLMTESGRFELKFRLDPENRPHQIYDEQMGKLEITNFERLKIMSYEDSLVTKLLFKPETGRTHQLRLCSSSIHGLGMPIVGDRLYGTPGKTLMLQALKLEFNHPITGKRLCFELKDEF